MGTTPPWNSPGAGVGYANKWDTLYVEGELVAALAEVTGDIGQKIDVQNVKGQKGAKTSNEGPEPATLSITLKMTYEEVQLLERLRDRIHPRKQDLTGPPVMIEHPAPNFWGIHRVRFRKVGLPQIQDDHFVLRLECVEHFEEPKPAKPKVTPKAPAKQTKASDYRSPISNLGTAGYNPDSILGGRPPPNPYALDF